MKLPRGLTAAKIEAAARRNRRTLDDTGFCLGCGAAVDGVEPDARECECEVCGEPQVYGAEELVLMTAF